MNEFIRDLWPTLFLVFMLGSIFGGVISYLLYRIIRIDVFMLERGYYLEKKKTFNAGVTVAIALVDSFLDFAKQQPLCFETKEVLIKLRGMMYAGKEK